MAFVVCALPRQEVDLAITYAYSFGTRDLPVGPASEFLGNDPLVLIAPAGLCEEVRRRGRAAVRDADWIAARDGAPSIASIMFACREAGFAPRTQHRGGSFDGMADMVAHGLGVAIVPEMSLPGERRALVAGEPTGQR